MHRKRPCPLCTPNNDSESGFREKIMSALLPDADLCGAPTHFRFGPKADQTTARDQFGLVPQA